MHAIFLVDVKNHTLYYKRNLPHYQPHGYAFFITTRLAGTIPKSVHDNLKKELYQELIMLSGIKNLTKRRRLYSELQERSFINYDSILDQANYGRKWLLVKSVANLVQNSIHFLEKKEYDLYAYTIMPNHIHLIFKPILNKNIYESGINDEIIFSATKIMKSLKMYTGREANKILKRSGRFWQHESYDHVIRNNQELFRITNYVLNNPVKANLCDSQDDWPWNYINHGLYHL